MLVCKTCVRCTRNISVRVPDAELDAWNSGELAQVALKSLTPGERELLISSICEPCFDAMFEKDDSFSNEQLADDLD